NSSTGETGARIAAELQRAGHEVVLLRARSAVPAPTGVSGEAFVTFADLDAALGRRLGDEHFDAVIHAAAVSDFAIAAVEVDGRAWRPGAGKLDSDSEPVLRLRRNPKLLAGLRGRSRNPALRVVAFKLTRGADPAAARAAVDALFADGSADLVVHNDLAERVEGGVFPATIWAAPGERMAACADRGELARTLSAQLSSLNSSHA